MLIKILVSPLLRIIKRRQRNRLRCIMRGYLILKRSGRLDRIAAVKQALTEHPLALTGQNVSPVVMEEGIESGEIVARQYLLAHVGGFSMNRALLRALGKRQGRVVFYLPREWRDLLCQHGFEVARVRSAALWQLYVFAMLLYGMWTIGRIAIDGIIATRSTDPRPKRYVFFANLGKGNLPQTINGIQSRDVISWYLQWPGKTQAIEAVHHSVPSVVPTMVGNVPVVPRPGALPHSLGMSAAGKYVLWGLCATFVALIDYLRGRWWHPLLLSEAALAAQVRALPQDRLAREYLFHNSGHIYRPLWTYEAERRGAAITFYFYSSNCEGFKGPNGYPPPYYGWKIATWPKYLVWDDYQADFVRRTVLHPGKIDVVGAIWFQDSPAEMPQIEKPGIAVFDVTPHRQSIYWTTGADHELYTGTTSKKFLEHSVNAIQPVDTVMLWKRKRQIGTFAHPCYRQLADRLCEHENVISVDPDISAWRVIESSCLVISMPFTSTALIAKEMGKPSIYYDPTCQLQRDDRAAHGIPLLSGPDELRAWIGSQMSCR